MIVPIDVTRPDPENDEPMTIEQVSALDAVVSPDLERFFEIAAEIMNQYATAREGAPRPDEPADQLDRSPDATP